MKKFPAWSFTAVMTLVVLTSGCGGKADNQVVVDPNAGSAEQQKKYDDYDKQMAEADANYQ